MKKNFYYRIIYICFAILLCACEKPTRPSFKLNTTVETLELNGDVSKIEIITISELPITAVVNEMLEMLEMGSYSYLLGNSELELNDKGQRKKVLYLDERGNTIRSTKFIYKDDILVKIQENDNNMSLKWNGDTLQSFGTDSNGEEFTIYSYHSCPTYFDSLKRYDKYNNLVAKCYTHKGNDGELIQESFYGDSLILIQISKKYVKEGKIYQIIKSQRPWSNFLSEILYEEDSTEFIFNKFDENNNWTECDIIHHGARSSQNFTAKSFRQITYRNEPPKKRLIDSYNYYKENYSLHDSLCEMTRYNIGDYSILVPDNMRPMSQEELFSYNYDFGFEQKNESQYAKILVSYQYDDFSEIVKTLKNNGKFQKVEETYIKQQFIEKFSNTNTPILDWLGCKYFKIGNQNIVCLEYIRRGFPIPVHVFNYAIYKNRELVNIVTSYRTNETHIWRKNLENAINGLKKE